MIACSLQFCLGDLDRVRQLVEVDGSNPMSRDGSVRHETSLHLAARYVG